MYTHSKVHVRWKAELSNSFALKNGVKQGGCLSPILFTLYLDGLLCKLKHLGIGCHIGRTYCGIFGYADDLALVSPSIFGLRQMIAVCEQYAHDFNILFNPKKSKLICFNMLLDIKPVITLCDKVVEVVDSEMYLGTKLFKDVDKKPMDEFIFDFERRCNHIIHNFKMCDSVTLKGIFSTYCESYYGCELFNYSKLYMSKLYISWRKIIRYIFRLPPRTHNYIVNQLGDNVTHRLDRRLCKYIHNMMHSSNVTVRQIIRQKFVSPTSTIADNYRYLFSKYNIAHEDWYRDVNHVIKCMVRTEYTNYEYVMSNTISE